MLSFLDFLTPCLTDFPSLSGYSFWRSLVISSSSSSSSLYVIVLESSAHGTLPIFHTLWEVFSISWPLRHWISFWDSDPYSVHMYYLLWLDIPYTFQTQLIQRQAHLPHPILDNLLWVFTLSGKSTAIYSWARAILGLIFLLLFSLSWTFSNPVSTIKFSYRLTHNFHIHLLAISTYHPHFQTIL